MDANSIIKLIEDGKTAEAKKQLDSYLDSLTLSDEESGRIYATIATLYVKVQNAFLDQYKELLEDVVDELKRINKKEKDLIEK